MMAHGDAREGEWRRKLANAVGSQYPSHYLGTRCIQHYYRWWRTPRLASSRLNWRPAHRADLNGLVRFARKTKSGFLRVCRHVSTDLYYNIHATILATVSPPAFRLSSYILPRDLPPRNAQVQQTVKQTRPLRPCRRFHFLTLRHV